MNYKGYGLHIDPAQLLFGNKICYIKRGGLTVDMVTASTENLAIAKAKKLIDYWKGKR